MEVGSQIVHGIYGSCGSGLLEVRGRSRGRCSQGSFWKLVEVGSWNPRNLWKLVEARKVLLHVRAREVALPQVRE